MNLEVQARFEELTREYKTRLPGTLETLKADLTAWFTNPAGEKQLEDAHYTLHKLAGTGTTFGLKKLTSYAKKAEKLVSSIIEDKPSDTPESRVLKESRKKAIFNLLEKMAHLI